MFEMNATTTSVGSDFAPTIIIKCQGRDDVRLVFGETSIREDDAFVLAMMTLQEFASQITTDLLGNGWVRK